MAVHIPSVKLNDGHTIPVLAYGTGTAWFKPANKRSSIDQTLVSSIKSAIKLGYHHLDGAEVYGTEPELGIAIKESKVPRERLFVTTKIIDSSIKDIPGALDASLKKLGLDYVDLYLIHSPFWAKSPADFQNAWAAMESVKRAGKARSIGVSNFVPSQLESVLKTATIVPAINQVEFHPYLQHIAPTSLASDGTDFITFHRKHAIALSSYGPLTPATRAKGGPLDPVLDRLAAKYRAGVGQVLLRWSMDKGFITITTSSKEARLKGYLDSLRFSLDREDVEEISRVGKEKFFRGFWNHIYSADDRS